MSGGARCVKAAEIGHFALEHSKWSESSVLKCTFMLLSWNQVPRRLGVEFSFPRPKRYFVKENNRKKVLSVQNQISLDSRARRNDVRGSWVIPKQVRAHGMTEQCLYAEKMKLYKYDLWFGNRKWLCETESALFVSQSHISTTLIS